MNEERRAISGYFGVGVMGFHLEDGPARKLDTKGEARAKQGRRGKGKDGGKV